MASRHVKAFLKWVHDVPGGRHDSFACDPLDYCARHTDDGRARSAPAWTQELDHSETTEADSCLPYGEKRGRFGTNAELRRVLGDGDLDDADDDFDGGSSGFLASSHTVPLQQQRVWSFTVPPSSATPHDAVPRVQFAWHPYLPIFAVARPDTPAAPASSWSSRSSYLLSSSSSTTSSASYASPTAGGGGAGCATCDSWIVELYQIGASGASSAVPRARHHDGHGRAADDVSDDASDDASGAGGGSGGSSYHRSAAGAFRVELGSNKGAVRRLAFQPHGGTNLLIGCTHSVWLAQFTMVEGGADSSGVLGGGGGRGGGGGGSGGVDGAASGLHGFSVSLAWLACVFHRPPLTRLAQKLVRRVLGLGQRASPTFLQDLCWSPDGAQLAACFSGEECVRLWDADLLMARPRGGAQPPHRELPVPLCRDGVSRLAWSPTGSYLFAAHAMGGLSTVWETERWGFHQWEADCLRACWPDTASGPVPGGRQVLFTVERAPLGQSSSAAAAAATEVAAAEAEAEAERAAAAADAGGGGGRGGGGGDDDDHDDHDDHDDDARSDARSRGRGGGGGAGADVQGGPPLVTAPAYVAATQRQQGGYTVVRPYTFSIDRPECDHEHHSLHLDGEGLLDIRREVARELLLEDFPASAVEVRARVCVCLRVRACVHRFAQSCE
jgi:WD40 repeat protein